MLSRQVGVFYGIRALKMLLLVGANPILIDFIFISST